MDDTSDFEKASKRLDAALRSIEDAVAADRKKQLNNDSLTERLQALEASLESERSTNQKLSAANQDVSGRIDNVISSIDGILDKN